MIKDYFIVQRNDKLIINLRRVDYYGNVDNKGKWFSYREICDNYKTALELLEELEEK